MLAISSASAQSTYTWANSNVSGTPTSPLNWLNSPQGSWTGGTPVGSNLNTIQFFANNTTALTNTATPSTQTSNVDNGGAAFELGTLTLSGLASATVNANLTETISGDALNFSAATGTINLDALNATRTITYNLNSDIQLGTVSSAGALTIQGNGTSAFNIGGIISELQVGGGSLVKSGSSTVSLTAANSYTGTTTLNAGTLNLSGAAGALTATSGLTFNGGGFTLTNTVAETGSGRVPDAAGITSNGGTITYTNTSGANVYAETIGSVALTSGQMNFNLATNQTGAGSQTLTLSGLTRAGATNSSAVSFSAATTAPNATKNRILVSGATQTTAGQIIGPWATTGTAANSQNDYAVYDASGYIVPANIAASAETDWANATDAYTLSTPAKTATALTATRNIAALKASSTATATSANTVNGSPNFTVASGHSFAVGDPVVLSSFGGDLKNFNVGRVYYVAGVTATTFTLTATPGSTAINAEAATSAQFTGGLKLDSGLDLGTTGILNSGNAPLAIGRTASGGQLTLPTAGAGNLYVTTGLSPVTSANSGLNGRISIEAPIVDNGGALTLVKNGAGVLRLQGTNTYTGGTVINAGTVIFTADSNFGEAGDAITFNGSGALSIGPNNSWSFASQGTVTLDRPVAVNNGAIAGLLYNGPGTTANVTGAITGVGGITAGRDRVVAFNGGSGTVNMNFTSTGNTFTGPLTLDDAGNSQTVHYNFRSLADSTSPITVNMQGGNFELRSDATANMSLPNRAIDLRTSGTTFRNQSGTYTMTLGAVSTTTSGAKELKLNNGGAGGFVAGNITNGAGTISVTRSGTGTFTLSGTNSYTGATTVSGGTLIVSGTGSTNTGAYAVTNATLRGTTPTAFGDTTNIGIGGSGILQLRGDANATFGKTTGGAAYTTSITANGATINVDQKTVAGTDQTFTLGAQTITSTAATVNTTFSGANNSSLILGAVTDTTVANGTVQFTNSITGGGSLTLASFAGTRTGTPTLQFSGTGSTSVTGAITETVPMALTKNGAGILTLGGANSYTGATAVNAGTLALEGASMASAITVSAGASLSFTLGSPASSTSTVNLTTGTVKITGTPTLPSYTLMTTSGITGTPTLDTPIPGYALEVDGTTLELNATSGDMTPPTLVSITDNVSGGPVNIGAAVTYTVTFDEDMNDATVTTADFGNNGTAVATIDSVTETTPGVFSVVATPTSPGTLVLSINALAVLEDVAGNALDTDPALLDDTTITVRNAYQTWALTNAISSAPGADKDGDGVNNAIEFLLGGDVSTNDLSKLPEATMTATDMIFTFERKRSSIDGITGCEVEVGTTLTGWPTSYTVGATTGSSDAGVVVTENSPAGFDTITVTVPKGSDPKKFGRLNVTVTE